MGAAPIDVAASEAPRDAAVRMALADAVLRVARAMLPAAAAEAMGPGAPDVREVLGSDPFPYTTRFQTIEDRGVRSALFAAGGDQAEEYVVVVEVDVDRGRVRDRLSAAGLIAAPEGVAVARSSRLILENLTEYAAYERIRQALTGLGVRSAVPVEAEPGRMVLELDSESEPRDLVRPLQLAVPELRLTPTGVDADVLTLRVEGRSLGRLGAPASPDPAAIDTRSRNRY